MKTRFSHARVLYLFALCAFLSNHLLAQEVVEIPSQVLAKAPKIFIDCRRCDEEYIRTEIPFVNYVRDRSQAEVHVLITEQHTGSGGTEYTIAFIGRKIFDGMNDTLRFFSKQNDTQEIVRRGLARALRTGFFRYALQTPIGEFLSVTYRGGDSNQLLEDPWNYWVFNLRARTEVNARKYEGSTRLSGEVSANHTSYDWKVRLSVEHDYDREYYEYTEGGESKTTDFISRRTDFDGLVARSIDDHWSIGLWGDAFTSTYENTRFSAGCSPAVEYNIFPYSESTYRELRLQYRIGASYNRYIDTTIFDKASEVLGSQALSLSFDLRQPWGSSYASVTGSNYLHDIRKFHVRFNAGLSVYAFEGISIDLRANYRAIRDQLSLPKGEATTEEVLTSQRQLATNYSFSFSVGISYTFGSIYSKVVNARFGGH